MSVWDEAKHNLKDFFSPRYPPTPCTWEELYLAEKVRNERLARYERERVERMTQYAERWPKAVTRRSVLEFSGNYTKAVGE